MSRYKPARKKAKQSKFIARSIPEFDKRREQKPTRRDTRRILRKHSGDIIFFNLSFNPVYKGLEYYKTKTEEIAGLLWERYHLYKLRSTKGKPHTLNRSMYIALVDIEDSNKKQRHVLSLTKSVKKFILGRKYLRASKVHIIAAPGFVYAVSKENKNPLLQIRKRKRKIESRVRKHKNLIYYSSEEEEETDIHVEEEETCIVSSSEEESSSSSSEESEPEEYDEDNEDDYETDGESEEEKEREGEGEKEREGEGEKEREGEGESEKEREGEKESNSDMLKRIQALAKEYNSDSSDSVNEDCN